MILKLLTTFKQKTPQISQFEGFFVVFSGRVGIRTPNLLIRSQVLYPSELRIRFFTFPVVLGLQR